MYQVFQNNFSILYVEGDKKMVAEYLICYQDDWYPSKKKYSYISEYNSKDEINRIFKGYFIDGFNNDSYMSFIKEKGLVNLMCNYWNNVIDKENKEKVRQLLIKKK